MTSKTGTSCQPSLKLRSVSASEAPVRDRKALLEVSVMPIPLTAEDSKRQSDSEPLVKAGSTGVLTPRCLVHLLHRYSVRNEDMIPLSPKPFMVPHI